MNKQAQTPKPTITSLAEATCTAIVGAYRRELAKLAVEEAGRLGDLYVVPAKIAMDTGRWTWPAIASRMPNTSVHVDVKEERTDVSQWQSVPNGKLRVVTGDYGDRKNYPQRKDGSFDFEKIGAWLVQDMRRMAERREAQAVREGSADMLANLRAELGLRELGGKCRLYASGDAEAPVHIDFSLSQNVSADKAREIVNALKALGLILPSEVTKE